MPLDYLKDAPPRIFDVHSHYPWGGDRGGAFTTDMQAEILAYTCRRLNIQRICLLGRPARNGWDATLAAHQRFPELVVPMAQVWLDQHGPDDIAALRERGFRGLKITTPSKDYDDEYYFPLYERAESLGMPILFHTGIRGGTIDYLNFPPRDAEHARQVSTEAEQTHRGTRRGAARMQPIFLDTIGIAFPDLKIIGAHLGYGFYDSATAVARWRRNVSFDISGGPGRPPAHRRTRPDRPRDLAGQIDLRQRLRRGPHEPRSHRLDGHLRADRPLRRRPGPHLVSQRG